MSEVKQYAQRDIMALDEAGNHYIRHVDHMTREKLHSKSDIAAELGWRDMQIAELKAQRDALAENEGYKQAFYKMAEILGIGARPDSPKNVFEQVMKPMLINLKKNETPEGYVLVPQQMHLSADAIESLCFHCGDGGFAFGEFTEGMLWVGDIENDDGTKTYGLNIATAEYPEEGSANISEFAAQLRAGKDGE